MFDPEYNLSQLKNFFLFFFSEYAEGFLLIQAFLNPPCLASLVRRPHSSTLAVVRLVLGLAEPREEGSDGLEGHTFPQLLGRVFAGLPLVEGLLFDHVLVVQSVEKHAQQICDRERQKESLSSCLCASRLPKTEPGQLTSRLLHLHHESLQGVQSLQLLLLIHVPLQQLASRLNQLAVHLVGVLTCRHSFK